MTDPDLLIPPQEQAERLVGMLGRDQLERLSRGRSREDVAFGIAARRHRALQDPPPAEALEAEVAEATEVAQGAAGLAGRVLGALMVLFFLSGWAFLGGGGLGILILFLTGQMDLSLLRDRWYVQSASGIGGLLFLLGCVGLVVCCIVLPLRTVVGRVVERRQRRALLDWALDRGVDQLGRGVPAPDTHHVGATRGCASFALVMGLGAGGFFVVLGGAPVTLLVLGEALLSDGDWGLVGAMAAMTAVGVLMFWGSYHLMKGLNDESDEDHLALTGVHCPEDRRTADDASSSDAEDEEDEDFIPDAEH